MTSNSSIKTRLPKTLRMALDALVVAGLMSTTASALENQLDLMLVASRVVGHATNTRGVHEKVRRSARNALLTGEIGLRSATASRSAKVARQTHAIARIPLTLSAH